MPSVRHHVLGDLYIQLTVTFPESLPETAFAQLEAALPARKEAEFPIDKEVDDVYLEEPDHAKQARRDADAMDEDDEGQQGGVQCAQVRSCSLSFRNTI